jgi:hypothetical protein
LTQPPPRSGGPSRGNFCAEPADQGPLSRTVRRRAKTRRCCAREGSRQPELGGDCRGRPVASSSWRAFSHNRIELPRVIDRARLGCGRPRPEAARPPTYARTAPSPSTSRTGERPAKQNVRRAGSVAERLFEMLRGLWRAPNHRRAFDRERLGRATGTASRPGRQPDVEQFRCTFAVTMMLSA